MLIQNVIELFNPDAKYQFPISKSCDGFVHVSFLVLMFWY